MTGVIQKEGIGYQTLPTSSEFMDTTSSKWYEVEALAQEEVFIVDPSSPVDNAGIKLGKYVKANQRFITEYTPEGYYHLTFGAGNQTPQSLLDTFSKNGVKLDMSKFLNNTALGDMVQGNSTLFIQYRVGGGKSSNVGAGAINSMGVHDFVVVGPSPQINQSVIGGANQMSVEEIRNYITYNFSAQQRAVTINDYVSKVRMMPGTFGAAAKVGVTEVENKVILDILSYTPDGKLTSRVPEPLRKNIATYLSNYRMLNDYISVGSAKVIDVSFDISLILDDSINQGEVITSVITQISDFFDVEKIEMGEDISLGALKQTIMKQAGVINIVDFKVFNKVGGEYSQSLSSQPYLPLTNRQLFLIDDTIYAQPNEIIQIRFPDKDIAIRTKTPVKPTFT